MLFNHTTYLDLLPIEIYELIQKFVYMNKFNNVLNELTYQLSNQIIHTETEYKEWTMYEKKYYNVLFNAFNIGLSNWTSVKKLRDGSFSRSFSWHYNKWLHTNYFNSHTKPNMVYKNPLHDDRTITLIRIFEELVNIIEEDSVHDFRQLITILEYDEISSFLLSLR